MTRILPQIEALQEIPFFHRTYAKAILGHIANKIAETDEIEVGTFSNGEQSGSFIGFDTDDFEDTRIELRYDHTEFFLTVEDNYDDMRCSTFEYRIPEDSELSGMIPAAVVSRLFQVANSDEFELEEEE